MPRAAAKPPGKENSMMTENKYEKIYRLANKKTGRSKWMDAAIFPLAVDLEELTGQPVSVSGPFGLRAEVYIKLGESTLIITPGFKDNQLELYYDTGRTTGRYEPLTCGDFNGLNNEQARLPGKLEDVAALFHKGELC